MKGLGNVCGKAGLTDGDDVGWWGIVEEFILFVMSGMAYSRDVVDSAKELLLQLFTEDVHRIFFDFQINKVLVTGVYTDGCS